MNPMQLARYVSTLSDDPRRKVGAVLVDKQGNNVSTGFNGFPLGHCIEKYADREYRRQHTVHAEVDALCKVQYLAPYHTLYVSFPPCPACMRQIVNAGVVRVICAPADATGMDAEWRWRWIHRFAESVQIARDNGVIIEVEK